jgi:hypothetical protein
MKLAEALIQRADAQKRLQQLQERLTRSARVQEGDTAPEDPQALLDEAAQVIVQWNTLVKQINRTNAATRFDDLRTLTDAIADRDALARERNLLAGVIAAATAPQHGYAYSQSNIKYFRAVNVAEVQRRADELARRYRELDSAIQAMNWNTDVIT